MTEPELLSLKADLENRFDAALRDLKDPDAHVTDGSFVYAHDGMVSACRQINRIASLKPSLIVEIGTGKGIGTLLLSRLAERVVTIDIGPYRLRRDVWDWGHADNIAAVIVDGDVSKIRLLQAMDFDLAVVDGDHSLMGCALDHEATLKCPAVLFHDYTPPYDNGPLRVAQSLDPACVVLDVPFFWRVADKDAAARLGAVG